MTIEKDGDEGLRISLDFETSPYEIATALVRGNDWDEDRLLALIREIDEDMSVWSFTLKLAAYAVEQVSDYALAEDNNHLAVRAEQLLNLLNKASEDIA